MTFSWTDRQFVGGALCLDFVNTVYYANDPDRRGDRLRDAADIAAWLSASVRFGSARDYARLVAVPAAAFDAGAVADVLVMRDCIDQVFRCAAAGLPAPSLAMRPVLYALGGAMADVALALEPDGIAIDIGPATGPSPATARAALAHSALALAHSAQIASLKSCPNCDWLFIDRSRNGSRVWCDMQTCGNQAKARRYQKRHDTNLTTVSDLDGLPT